MSCHELVELLRAEKVDLKDELLKHKYYLSEKAGHDVGLKEAESSFIDNYLPIWAEGYRKAYCSLVCKHKCMDWPSESTRDGIKE